MAVTVNINGITGFSPYDVYICDEFGDDCIYINTITGAPYNFIIPAPYDDETIYTLKLIDSVSCIISGTSIVGGSTPTPTPTPAETPPITPTVTPTPTSTNPPPLDPDAQAFLIATGIETEPESHAINILVTDLKYYGLWDKMILLYPFVGGTANTHKYNLKDPQDTDLAGRLTFYSGLTHGISGVTGNGIDGWADTHRSPLDIITSADSQHISVYSTTNNKKVPAWNNVASEVSTGSFSYSGGTALAINYWNGANYRALASLSSSDYYSILNSDSRGMYFTSREPSIGTNRILLAKNNTFVNDSASIIEGLNSSTYKLFVDAWWPTPPWGSNNHSMQNLAWVSVGNGLTEDDITNLYNVVQAYQTELGRNV